MGSIAHQIQALPDTEAMPKGAGISDRPPMVPGANVIDLPILSQMGRPHSHQLLPSPLHLCQTEVSVHGTPPRSTIRALRRLPPGP
ncbi:hypothetical protein SBA6_490012 [Candidatus Sulfopaludibacter sp. SbA6]|nr:hypothetical protein SBA6_490012 [Candidatus Sulfopaludibacter sp. SbA6]